MDNLEEILDLIQSCKVDFDKDEIYYYLVEEVCQMSQITSVEKAGKLYLGIQEKLIDIYSLALKAYYKDDRDRDLIIDRENQVLQLI